MSTLAGLIKGERRARWTLFYAKLTHVDSGVDPILARAYMDLAEAADRLAVATDRFVEDKDCALYEALAALANYQRVRNG
jgi:hypothetical protein